MLRLRQKSDSQVMIRAGREEESIITDGKLRLGQLPAFCDYFILSVLKYAFCSSVIRKLSVAF